MRFEFNDLHELKDFLTWAGYVRPLAPVMDLTVQHASGTHSVPSGKLAAVKTYADMVDPLLNAEGAPPTEGAKAEPVEEPAKRKRRTKAEIEADKTAEAARLSAHNQANAIADANLAEHGAETAAAYAKQPETTPAGTAAVVAPENTGNPFAQQSLPAEEKTQEPAKAAAPANATPEQVKQFEINEFVAARLAERPTLDQREHLLLARTFIGKHGMSKYNESFNLVGLGPNVMTYTEADCARHAAALDFLSLE